MGRRTSPCASASWTVRSRPRSAFPAAFSEALEEGGSSGVGLRRILDTVSDEVRLGERDGASWVTLTKQVNGSGA